MARLRNTVEYFPHYINESKTLFVLESTYGNNGYAFWFKLLEMLAGNEGHFIDCNKKATWMFLLSKTRVDEKTANDIMDTLAEVEAIDAELWNNRIVWSDNFIKNVGDVYTKRKRDAPERPQPHPTSPNLTRNDSYPTQVGSRGEERKVNEINIMSDSDESRPVENQVSDDPPKKISSADRKKNERDKLVKDVMAYYNLATKSRLGDTVHGNIKHIRARFNEGFKNIDDYKRVIDFKYHEWKDDPKMQEYIRPQTLFGDKFEVYNMEALKRAADSSKDESIPKPKDHKELMLEEYREKRSDIMESYRLKMRVYYQQEVDHKCDWRKAHGIEVVSRFKPTLDEVALWCRDEKKVDVTKKPYTWVPDYFARKAELEKLKQEYKEYIPLDEYEKVREF